MSEHEKQDPAALGREKVEETADAARSRAGTLRDEAAQAALDVASGAKARVASEVNARAEGARDTVAEAIEDTAATLRTAAERMSDGTPQSEAVHRAANTVSGVATQVRDTDLATLTDDLSGIARRYPVAFLAGAGLLGFAAGRFLRSSGRPATPDYDPPSPAAYPVPAPAPTRAVASPVDATPSRPPASAAASDIRPKPAPATAPVGHVSSKEG